MQNRTLIIISHKFHEVHPDGNKIYVKGGFPLITNEFAKYFECIILAVPVKINANINTPNPYSENVIINRLDLGETILGKLKKFIKIGKIIKRNNGIVYAMAPNMTGIIGIVFAWLFRKDFFVSVDTDKAEVFLVQAKNKWVGYIKSTLIKNFHYSLIKRFTKNRPVFISGNMFLGENKNWHQWIKSTHKLSEISRYRVPTKRGTDDPFTIVYVGRLSPEKNVELILRAVKDLPKKEYRLYIIGEGSELKKLRETAGSLKLSNVEFKGYIDNKYLKENNFFNADLLILPSKSERQGKVLTEAMACSIPVLASNTQGISSIIIHQINGILFDPNNISELSNWIIELNRNHSLRSEITQTGYNFIRRHALDIEIKKIIKIVQNYYEQK